MAFDITAVGMPNVHIVMRCSKVVQDARNSGLDHLVDAIFHVHKDLGRNDSVVAGLDNLPVFKQGAEALSAASQAIGIASDGVYRGR